MVSDENPNPEHIYNADETALYWLSTLPLSHPCLMAMPGSNFFLQSLLMLAFHHTVTYLTIYQPVIPLKVVSQYKAYTHTSMNTYIYTPLNLPFGPQRRKVHPAQTLQIKAVSQMGVRALSALRFILPLHTQLMSSFSKAHDMQ